MRFNLFVKGQAHYISFAVACVATIGSLYFSEVMLFQPCLYCWYIRILMYPLVPILGIAAVRNDIKQYVYVLPFTVLGIAMSLYLYLMQKLPSLAGTGTACGVVPCNTIYINWLGFITIPLLALIAFIIIFIFQLLLWRVTKKSY